MSVPAVRRLWEGLPQTAGRDCLKCGPKASTDAWTLFMTAYEASDREAASPSDARQFAPRYLWAMATGALAVVAFFAATLVGLDRLGHLPPPQIANDLCADEKLRFLRNSPAFRSPAFAPDVLIVGSSVSLRQFDGEAVEHVTNGRVRALNGGFCGLKINETAFATRFFLGRYPSIQEVVTVVAPQDLTKCRSSEAEIFDAGDVRRYVYGDAWVLPFYLKYFDPFTFAKNVYMLAAGHVFRWSSGFDRYGALPYDTDQRQTRLVYGALAAFDPTCFQALRALADELKAENRRLVVAAMPMHPHWTARYDPERRRMRELEARLDDALAGTGAQLWRPGTFALTADDYVDAIHIRWSAAKRFSRALARETGLGQAIVAHQAAGAEPPIMPPGQGH